MKEIKKVVLFLLLFVHEITAQVPSSLPKVEFIDLSSGSGEIYRLFISLPDKYELTEKGFPVMYILDADFNFIQIANKYKELVQSHQIEEAILIGIGYGTCNLENGNNRWQDFSPTHIKRYPKSGQAHKFKDFLVDKLTPFVSESFRINGKSTIHGHSMAGLFLTYLLFEQPTLFTQYMITSPALWWDKEKVFEYEKSYFASHNALTAKIFLSVAGKEGKKMVYNWKKLKAILEKRSDDMINIKTQYYHELTHLGVIANAVEDGLHYLCK